ncbi:hypothetical protein [Bacillus cereus]|uniref:hypothetical protein n=1 Tax=Bacillus cereus TaxID=1396 RepID=UPI000BFDE8D6|nr:hypothetical protein [Bacillus cereus]PGQ52662.1 hypothetical protein COA22_21575 [Bacillus cereus]PGY40648.1 hypothetical protein COE10_19005 [Bacillus cereus]
MPHNILNINEKTIKKTVYYLIAVGVFFMLLRLLDTLPAYSFVEDYGHKIFAVRASLLDFLLRIAPLFITVVIAISSLTVNSYTGTFLNLLLEDKSLKNLVIFTFSYVFYHLLVVFFVGNPSEITNDFLVGNFVTYTGDLIFGLLYSLFICTTSLHIFLYCSPRALKEKFLKEIKNSIKIINREIHLSDRDELNTSNVYRLNNQIGLFTNLLMRSIKSKDYKDISNTIQDISGIWKDFVEYPKNDSLRDLVNEHFYAQIEKIKLNETNTLPKKTLKANSKIIFTPKLKANSKIVPNIDGEIKYRIVTNKKLEFYSKIISELDKLSGKASKEKQKTFENCVNKLGQVFIDCFDVGFSQGEYFVCDEILKSLYKISETNDIQIEDIEKLFKIYSEIFEVTMRYDKKSQTTKYINLIMSYVNKIYNKHIDEINDFNVYYQFLIIAVNLNDAKVTKSILIKFRELLSKEAANYKDAIFQLKKILLHTLKFKRMKCFAELIRFTVVNQLNLDMINEVLAEGIIFEKNLDNFQELLDELTDPTDQQGVNYRKEIYYSVKLYIIWFSYYTLQLRISPRRINQEYQNLQIPKNIVENVPFEIIRTILLDVETHLDNWRKLFVTQEKYYFVKNTYLLLRPADRDLFCDEIEKFGETEMWKKMIERTGCVG